MTIVDDEVVSFDQLMDEFVFFELPVTGVEINGPKFDMVNLCLKSSTRNPAPRLYWCAANRVVAEENLAGKIAGLYGRLKDKTSAEFTYACYLSSGYLDDHVRADRTAFDIAERDPGSTLDGTPSLEDIRTAVLHEVEQLLSESLAAAREEGKGRVTEFVSNQAPRYRPVLSRLEPLGVTVDPSIKDQDLELSLDSSRWLTGTGSGGKSAPLPSIVVVEIKRPMRNDASEDKDAIQQCLDYIKRVRSGGVLTSSGRPIPPSHDQPAFCYMLADLTPTMVSRCEYASLRPTYDGMGYFGFNEPHKAYIEVMSFDRLVRSATERNRAFFDKLGLPSS